MLASHLITILQDSIKASGDFRILTPGGDGTAVEIAPYEKQQQDGTFQQLELGLLPLFIRQYLPEDALNQFAIITGKSINA